MKNENNETVISPLNDDMLRNIAQTGGGSHIQSGNAIAAVEALSKNLKTLEKEDYEAKEFTDYQDQYQYFIALGLIFLLLEFIVFDTRNKIFAQ